MTTIKAYKMDGLGNSFIIIDRRKNDINLEKKEIIKLSKIESFDQIIFIDKEKNNVSPIQIYNQDGNEVDACGNGSRCVAYILGKEKNISRVSLETKNRILEASLLKEKLVKINMGKPNFDWKKIPISKNIDQKDISLVLNEVKLNNGFALNVGNPHIIFFVRNCFQYDLKKIGPLVETHNLFPEKCNLTLAQIEGRNSIKINVWERGAGQTKACGTAACATSVAAYCKNLTDRKTKIIFELGSLEIEYNSDENIFMTGPVSEINKVNISI